MAFLQTFISAKKQKFFKNRFAMKIQKFKLHIQTSVRLHKDFLRIAIGKRSNI